MNIPVVRNIRDLPGPAGIPFLGNALQLKANQAHLQFEEWAREFGTPYRLSIGPKNLVIWTDVEIANAVLRDRPQKFRRGGKISEIMNEMSVGGLFAAEGADWFHQRKVVTEALNIKHLSNFYPTLSTIATRLHRRFALAADTGKTVDMLHELTGFTVDVICTLAFGVDPNTLEQGNDRIQRHLGEIFPMLMKRLMTPFPYWRWIRLPRDRRLDLSLKEVKAFVQDLIDTTRHKLERNPDHPAINLLETLILSEKEIGSVVTDDLIIANVLTLLLAGEDTTAHSLAWSIFHLAAQQELQNVLAQEVATYMPASALYPGYDELQQLNILEGVVNEALRFKPVVGMLSLSPIEDSIIGNVAMPANSIAYFLLRPPMLDENNFAEPKLFDPSRWLSKHSQNRTHERKAFLQFGTGLRVCPGRQLANIEMRLVLSMLLKNFRIELACPREEIKEVCAFTITPNKMPVRLYLR